MNVVFRADASLHIGTGHVIRCLTLADELKEKGAEIIFICRDFPGHLANIIQHKGYQVLLLSISEYHEYKNSENTVKSHEAWLDDSMGQDAAQTHLLLSSQGHIDWLVVDHYAIDARWQQRQNVVVDKILVIDDLADRKHSCDILLDQNYYHDMTKRYTGLVPDHCQQLLGPGFSLLRKDFREARLHVKKRDGAIRKIFVFFGGVDLSNMTGRVIEAISGLGLTDIVVDVVIGKTNPHQNNIEKLCQDAENINLHIQVQNMAEIMAGADLSIGSGGTVTWERCCLGLPAIAWPVAENQVELLKDSAIAGLVYVPDTDNPSVNDITQYVKTFLNSPLLCSHMSELGLAVTDGRGAIKVANLMATVGIDLQPVEKADMQKLYEWRNDNRVRKYSRNSDAITFDQHKKWFNVVMSDPDKHVFIGYSGDNEIGVLRFDCNYDQAEVSIYLVPGKQGKGFGVPLVLAGESWLENHCPRIRHIAADVLPENRVSNKLFEKCGYKVNMIQYRKSLG